MLVTLKLELAARSYHS